MIPELPSLLELFIELSVPLWTDNRNLYTAIVIPPYEHYRLGKDSKGAPALLIKLDSSQGRN